MPEPYPFPDAPKNRDVKFLNPELSPVSLGLDGETPIIITPPCKETNYIGFIFQGNRELLRFALIVDDEMQAVPILEDGKVTTLEAIKNVAFKVVLGGERYEKLKHIIEGAK